MIGDGEHTGWRVDIRTGEVRPVELPDTDLEGSSAGGPSLDSTAIADEAALRRIRQLPKEVGLMLMSVGVFGVVLPGVVGAPAVVAGGLVLWPRGFSGVESWLRRRYPGLHRQSMRQIERYLNDLERRFPDSGG